MLRLTLLTVSLVVFAGCGEPNSRYCENGAHAEDPTCGDAGGGEPCKTSTDCKDLDFPACDLADNGGTCALCTADDHAACKGLTPHCEDHACVACVDDSDCGAPGVGVCLPTGGCADPSSIIHAVSTGGLPLPSCGGIGAGNACTLDTALTLPRSSTRNVIKLDDAGPYVAIINNFDVNTDAMTELTIDARGAVLHHNSNSDGPILTISSSNTTNKAVTILGGTIEGAIGGTAEGIKCGSKATLAVVGTTIRMNDGFGINAADTCTLTLSRSQIVSNRGGGINVVNGSKFVIVGNMVLRNGDATSQNAGVTINTTAGPTNRLEFNTIANNAVMTGTPTAGVDCKAGTFTASHNIIWNNTIGGNASTAPQVANTCMNSYSTIGPMAFAGTGNLNDNPLLTSDGHLGPGSPATQKAELGADLSGIASRDIDGDLRVAPADLGADQLPRP